MNENRSAPQIQVLIVESSDVTRRFLVQRLEADPRIRVVGALGRAQAALDFLHTNQPDLLLMGDTLADLDSFETTRRIMETRPLPIILCADAVAADDTVFRSLEAGAVACVQKPRLLDGEGMEATTARLIQAVKLMSEVKVVRRWSRSTMRAPPQATTGERDFVSGQCIIGIGASTGGPIVLQTILAALPRDFPAPILVVQHIARGFLPGMADWLRQTSGLKVQIAAHGIRPQGGSVYLAPDDFHMGVGGTGRIVLCKDLAEGHLCPSVAFLFRSLAESYGALAVGVLLTGMGKDGARELKQMRDIGAVTIVQDSATSVVHGMPGEAIALGAALHVSPADRIAGMLIALAQAPRRVERK